MPKGVRVGNLMIIHCSYTLIPHITHVCTTNMVVDSTIIGILGNERFIPLASKCCCFL